MITTVIIAIVCFAVGGGLSYMLFRYGLKSKYDIIIKEAQTEAEVIKKNKLLEVKEKFIHMKAEMEKQANARTAKPLYHLSGQMLRHTDLKPGYNPQIGNFLPLTVEKHCSHGKYNAKKHRKTHSSLHLSVFC